MFFMLIKRNVPNCVWVKHTPLPSDLHQLHYDTCQRHWVGFANLHTFDLVSCSALQHIPATEYVHIYFNLEYQHSHFFKFSFNCYILYLVDLRALTGKSQGISYSGLTVGSETIASRQSARDQCPDKNSIQDQYRPRTCWTEWRKWMDISGSFHDRYC